MLNVENFDDLKVARVVCSPLSIALITEIPGNWTQSESEREFFPLQRKKYRFGEFRWFLKMFRPNWLSNENQQFKIIDGWSGGKF